MFLKRHLLLYCMVLVALVCVVKGLKPCECESLHLRTDQLSCLGSSTSECPIPLIHISMISFSISKYQQMVRNLNIPCGCWHWLALPMWPVEAQEASASQKQDIKSRLAAMSQAPDIAGLALASSRHTLCVSAMQSAMQSGALMFRHVSTKNMFASDFGLFWIVSDVCCCLMWLGPYGPSRRRRSIAPQ